MFFFIKGNPIIYVVFTTVTEFERLELKVLEGLNFNLLSLMSRETFLETAGNIGNSRIVSFKTCSVYVKAVISAMYKSSSKSRNTDTISS